MGAPRYPHHAWTWRRAPARGGARYSQCAQRGWAAATDTATVAGGGSWCRMLSLHAPDGLSPERTAHSGAQPPPAGSGAPAGCRAWRSQDWAPQPTMVPGLHLLGLGGQAHWWGGGAACASPPSLTGREQACGLTTEEAEGGCRDLELAPAGLAGLRGWGWGQGGGGGRAGDLERA